MVGLQFPAGVMTNCRTITLMSTNKTHHHPFTCTTLIPFFNDFVHPRVYDFIKPGKVVEWRLSFSTCQVVEEADSRNQDIPRSPSGDRLCFYPLGYWVIWYTIPSLGVASCPWCSLSNILFGLLVKIFDIQNWPCFI